MSEEKKVKRGLNAFDAVVILLVLALIGTFAYRVYMGFTAEKDKGESGYVVRIECTDVYESFTKYVKNGEPIYLSSTGDLLGYAYAPAGGAVFAVVNSESTFEYEETEAETETVSTEEGTVEEKEALEVYQTVDLAGQLKLAGTVEKSKQGDYYVVGSVNIREGSTLSVYTKNTEFTVVIKSISEITQ